MEKASLGFSLFVLGFLVAQLIYMRWLDRSSARFNAACDRTQFYRDLLEKCEKERDLLRQKLDGFRKKHLAE